MRKTLIQEALLTVADVKRTVEETAKAALTEQVGRKVNEEIRKIFESEIEGDASLGLNQEAKGDNEENEEIPDVSIEDDTEVKEEGVDNFGEVKCETEAKEDHEEPDGDEVVEDEPVKEEGVETPSVSEIAEVYEMIMKEMQITALPKDVIEKPEDAVDVTEGDWADGKPEGTEKKFQVKESKMLKKLLRMFRESVNSNNQKDVLIRKLISEMKGINLFNTKLLYSQKILGENTLSNTERKRVLYMFDTAKSINECKAIYRSFTNALTFNKSRLQEGISRKIGSLNRTQLNESGKKGGEDKDRNRMFVLAGIKSDEE